MECRLIFSQLFHGFGYYDRLIFDCGTYKQLGNKKRESLMEIPNQWKRIIKTTNDSCTNIVYLSHHLVKNNRIVALEKLH